MAIPAHGLFGPLNRAIVNVLGLDCVIVLPGGTVTVKVKARMPGGNLAADGGFGRPGVQGLLTDALFTEADVPGLADGTVLTLGGQDWIVRSPLPDGRGKVRCDLEKA